MAKKITPGMETYLETIKKIEEEKKVVRVKGIARKLRVKMPTVTEALRNLCEEGLIRHEKYGHIELTPEGNKLAEEIDSRHQILFSFLREILGVDSQLADEDACRIEHVISRATVRRLVKFVHFVKDFPGGKRLLENFRNHLRDEKGICEEKKENGHVQ